MNREESSDLSVLRAGNRWQTDDVGCPAPKGQMTELRGCEPGESSVYPICCHVLGVLFVALLLCGCSWNPHSLTNQTRQPFPGKPTVDGWVSVDFGIDADYISGHRGRMGELYDEFVGQLFDDGLTMKDTGWLKPTYGNKNMLWTCDGGIGKRRVQSFSRSMKEFPVEAYEFKEGEIEAKGRWLYSGYTTKTNGNDQEFQSFVFVCEGTSTGISLFYWGEGTVIAEDQVAPSIKILLSELSSYCR